MRSRQEAPAIARSREGPGQTTPMACAREECVAYTLANAAAAGVPRLETIMPTQIGRDELRELAGRGAG
jgi:hypothetical protein